jgi:PAS domain S-box-containing protein
VKFAPDWSTASSTAAAVMDSPGSLPVHAGADNLKAARLLIVDDDEGVLFLMANVLRHAGYHVDTVMSGQEALEWLGTRSADLLLLDLRLDDLPALEFMHRMKADGHDLPFVIVTGNGDERTAVEMMKQGAIDYVMKNGGLLDLLPETVRRAISTANRERQLRAAYDAVRLRQQRYETAIQTALDGFARLNRAGDFLEVNDALCELLGHRECDLLNTSLFDDGASFLPEGICREIAELPAESSARFFTGLRHRDGHEREVTLSVRASGSEIFAFVHDRSHERRLEREVLEITETERRRVGRELHDGLGQCLTAVELMCHAHAAELRSTSPDQVAAAERISTYIHQAGVQARRVAHGMSPVRLQEEGLMMALNDLAQLTDSAGISCDFDCNPPVYVSDNLVATQLFRIAQEAVNNALKYAAAKKISMSLSDCGDTLKLTIADDGVGLPEVPPTVLNNARDTGGMGLQLMQYRARLIGGELRIQSEAMHGVTVAAIVPKPH